MKINWIAGMGICVVCAFLTCAPTVQAQASKPAAKPAVEKPDGLGPFVMEVRQGEDKTVKTRVWLIRRKKDMVWLNRRTRSGTYIEVGMSDADIVKLEAPRPTAFALAEKAESDPECRKAQRALHVVSKQLLPYRDFQGIACDEALFLEGILLEKLERWDNALKLYNDILDQKYESTMAVQAKVHAGLCLLQKKDYKAALEHLDKGAISPDDVKLLVDVSFGRGTAFQALEQYDDAIMEYLYPVVFHPFVDDNEVRCLKAVVPCYVAREDWDAVFKTFYALKKSYPDAEETQETRDYLEDYKEELGRELDFQIEYEDDEIDINEEGEEDEA